MTKASVGVPPQDECPVGARLIPLTQGRFAIVDAEDFARLNQFKWCLKDGYAIHSRPRSLGPPRNLYMHRVIKDVGGRVSVDHGNRNKLDNRRVNLRLVSHAQNMQNKSRYSNNRTGFTVVHWRTGKWRAEIKYRGKTRFLGYFGSKEEAARARDKKALELWGKGARLNFPRSGGTTGP